MINLHPESFSFIMIRHFTIHGQLLVNHFMSHLSPPSLTNPHNVLPHMKPTPFSMFWQQYKIFIIIHISFSFTSIFIRLFTIHGQLLGNHLMRQLSPPSLTNPHNVLPHMKPTPFSMFWQQHKICIIIHMSYTMLRLITLMIKE